jgi:hypothetical protein
VNGLTLVAGGMVAGLSYELVCRPWDIARRTVYQHRFDQPGTTRVYAPLVEKLRGDGLLSFFRDPDASAVDHTAKHASSTRRRLYHIARSLARVGPWGVGFLAWEALGPSGHL